jgi:hypothetical protein
MLHIATIDEPSNSTQIVTVHARRRLMGYQKGQELQLVLCRWFAGLNLHVARDVVAGAHDDEYVV